MVNLTDKMRSNGIDREQRNDKHIGLDSNF